MSANNQLPNNDTDLMLARQIGELLESRSNFKSLNNPFIDSINSFKMAELDELETTELDSDGLWDLITQQTKPIHVPVLIPFYRRNSWAWASAAAVMLIAFIGIFWMNTFSEPKLIAESMASKVEVTLTDGTLVTLRPYSKLYEIEYSDTKRAYQLMGEAFLHVAKDPTKPFTLDAGEGSITVLGTQFNVSTWGNSTSVFLEEGKIQFSNSKQYSVVLNPGESASLQNGKLEVIEISNPDVFKDWIESRLRLDQTPIQAAISEIEQHYHVEIDISAIANRGELVSGSIPLDGVDKTLNDLGVILGGTFKSTNSNSYQYIPLSN